MLAVARQTYNNPQPYQPMLKRVNNQKRRAKVNPNTFLSLTVIVCISVMMICYLCMCAKLISCQYKIFNVSESKQSLEKEKIELQLAIEKLSSLDRIEKIASIKLGLKAPDKRHIIDITPQTFVAKEKSEKYYAMKGQTLTQY